MTRTRKPKVPAFDEVLTGKVPTDPDPIDPSDEELDNVFREFPQHDACLELWRTTEKGGKPSFLGELSPSEFTFGNVMREFGGGRYIVKGKYKDGEVIKRSFDIEGDAYPVKRKIPQPSGNAPVAPVLQAPQTIEMVRKEDGSFDALASMMTMMKTLVVELKSSEDQVLDKMVKYKALFGSTEKSQTPIHEAIGMIKTGIELGSASQGGDGGFPWLLALDKLQGPLTELVSTIKAAVTRQSPSMASVVPNSLTPPVASQPVSQGAPMPSASPGEPPNMEIILKGAVQHVLPNLVTGAAREAEPEFYADFLLDQIPERFYTTAKTWLEKPDCLDQLQAMNPGVSGYRPWFELLRVELLKALNEEVSDAPRPLQSESTSDAATDRSADL